MCFQGNHFQIPGVVYIIPIPLQTQTDAFIQYSDRFLIPPPFDQVLSSRLIILYPDIRFFFSPSQQFLSLLKEAVTVPAIFVHQLPDIGQSQQEIGPLGTRILLRSVLHQLRILLFRQPVIPNAKQVLRIIHHGNLIIHSVLSNPFDQLRIGSPHLFFFLYVILTYDQLEQFFIQADRRLLPIISLSVRTDIRLHFHSLFHVTYYRITVPDNQSSQCQ